MSPRQARFGWSALALGAALLAVTTLRSGEPQPAPPAAPLTAAPAAVRPAADVGDPAALLPAGTVVYGRWAGTAAAGDAFAETAAYESLVKSGLADAVAEAYRGAADSATAREELPPQAGHLIALGEAAVENGVSFGLSVAPPSNGAAGGNAPPFPNLTVVLPGAAEAGEALLESLGEDERDRLRLRTVEMQGVSVSIGNIPGAPPFFPFGTWRAGEHLVVAVGPGAIEAAVAVTAGTADGLDSHRLTSVDLAGIPPMLTEGWVDFAAIAERFGDTVAYPADWRESGAVTVGELFGVLGLDAVDHYRGELRADGRYLRGHGAWVLSGEPKGLFTLLDPPEIGRGDLPPLPAAVTNFAVGSFDLARLYDSLMDGAEEFAELVPPGQPREVAANLRQMVPGLAGFDVRGDLLGSLGNVYAAYGDPNDGGLFGLGGVAAVSVKDAPKLRAVMGRLVERIVDGLPPDAKRQVAVTRGTRAGAEVVSVSVAGFFLPSYAVTDDWIVFAPGPQAVTAFLLRADGTLPRWEPTGPLAESFARVPERFTTLTVTDPRPGAQLLNGLVGTALPAVQQFAGGGEPAFVDLPPAELVTGPLFPNVGWVEKTADGVRGTQLTSLPAGPGGGSAAVATPAVLVSLLLPAIQQAREAARRSQSQNNLKQLGLSAHNHHSIEKSFPRGTVAGTNLPPQRRLSWVPALLPYLEQRALANRLDPKRPWDAGPNAEAARTVLPTFINPSVPAGETDDDGYALTHYVGIAGVGPDAAASPVQTEKTGVFGYDRQTALRELKDGTANTLMYGSVHEGLGPWARGGRATVRAFTRQPYIDGPDGFGGHAGGTNFGLADGSVRFLSADTDPAVLEAMATAAGGEVVRVP